jgi:acyl-CoA reductase-like NAD-dependent aldehyde dehydrogenase
MGLSFAIQWLKGIRQLEASCGRHSTLLGAVIRIVLWNYPILLLACRKITSAVVTGDPIIIKPSPLMSARDVKLCGLSQRILLRDVIQRFSGGDALGPWLTSHPIPAKISFISSTLVGKKIME